MDKQMHGFHPVEKESNSINMGVDDAIQNAMPYSQLTDSSANSAEATKVGETHLDLNTTAITISATCAPDEQLGRNCTTTIPTSSCNSADILPRLIKVYKKKIKLGAWISLLIIIISIIVSSVCFVFVKNNAVKNENIATPLVFGIFGIIFSISFLIVVCVLCHSLRNGLDWMNNVLHIIQLDGETWRNQVNSIQNTVPAKVSKGICEGNIYGRLIMRPHGHIVLAEDGIIIDELFVIRYDMYVVLRVDLIDNTTRTGFILRIFLVTRLNSEHGIDKGKQIAFEVYLFMSAHIQIQALADIRQSILSNSHRCLAASGFYKNSRVNPQLNPSTV